METFHSQEGNQIVTSVFNTLNYFVYFLSSL